MKQSTIPQSIVRLAAIVAIMTALVLTAVSAAASNTVIGLTECHQDSCRVVTLDDLKRPTRDAQRAAAQPIRFSTDRFSPHLIP